MDEIYRNKFIIAGAMVIAAAIIGGSLYAIQVNKQDSIERQQRVDIEERLTKDSFERNLKCQDLLKTLKQRWNNVVGIYYDQRLNTCMVKYLEEGEVLESPLEDMQDITE